ncbi:MAG TPA: hypothetical protein DCM07_03205, partial [Planctomycetaceae bacterium]|nr:hypothetical protein [Planctomycetaceae bacterium]
MPSDQQYLQILAQHCKDDPNTVFKNAENKQQAIAYGKWIHEYNKVKQQQQPILKAAIAQDW